MTPSPDARKRAPRVAISCLVMVSSAALLAPVIAPYDPALQHDIAALKNQLPSLRFPLGTDPFSRDTLSRLLHGARTSLFVAVIATSIATTIGCVWGMVSGWSIAAPSRLMNIAVDVFRSIPRLLLLLGVFAIAGSLSAASLAIMVGLMLWPVIASVTHAEIARLRSSAFIEAAVATGTTRWSMARRHLVPHLAPSLLASGVPLFADVIAFEAGLSFVGLGVRAPRSTWGGMLQDALPYLQSAWWVALIPCIGLVITVMAISALAQWMDERRAVTSSPTTLVSSQ